MTNYITSQSQPGAICFAWTPEGSPKKGFVLTTDEIMIAQDVLAERLSHMKFGAHDKLLIETLHYNPGEFRPGD